MPPPTSDSDQSTAPQVVFFDLDGTLTSYQRSVNKVLPRLLDSVGEELDDVSEPAFRSAYWSILQELEDQERRGTIPLSLLKDRGDRFRRVLERVSPGTEHHGEEMGREYGRLMAQTVAPFDGMLPVLERLARSFTLGIVTEGSSRVQRSKIRNLGLEQLFEHIVISDEVGLHKPGVEIFRLAIRRGGAPGRRTWMIGDRLDWDLRPARRAGMETILFAGEDLYSWDEVEVREWASHVVTSYAEIEGVLLGHLDGQAATIRSPE